MTADDLRGALITGTLTRAEIADALTGHKAAPLGAEEGWWRCSCGRVFFSNLGWAICPETGTEPQPYHPIVVLWRPR